MKWSTGLKEDQKELSTRAVCAITVAPPIKDTDSELKMRTSRPL